MGKLLGLTLAETRTRVGHLSQVARVDHFTVDNGPGRGTRLLRLVTGGGLELEVHPDRALDLGQMTVHGVPLAWISPTQIAHPAFCDVNGFGFLKTFGGGLLATCGLDHYGPPSDDGGEAFGQHGRIGAIPATLTQAGIEGDALVVRGVVQQTRVHGENLELKREIRSELGSTAVTVTDTVTNLGSREQPHMILYHCNFGWPLLSEHSEMIVPSTQVQPATAHAETDPWAHVEAPVRGYQERVYLHTFDRAKKIQVKLVNPKLDLGMKMSFDGAALPALCEWKMLGENHYVLGLEPTNVGHLAGRGSARAAGVLPVLAPGVSASYAITFEAGRLRTL